MGADQGCIAAAFIDRSQRNARLWSQIADEIDEHLARQTPPDADHTDQYAMFDHLEIP